MSLSKLLIFDNGAQRQIAPGDLVVSGETFLATNTTAAITITASMLLAGKILRSAAGAQTDTIDSAANLIAGLGNGLSLSNGMTFRVMWIGTTAQTITVTATANTGVTVNRGAIAASSGKEFLVTIVNGTPVQTFAGTTVNASAVLSGFTQAQLSLLSVGMIVTNVQAGQQGNTIIAINQNAGTITMSGNSNATNTTAVNFTFSPIVQFDGLLQGLS